MSFNETIIDKIYDDNLDYVIKHVPKKYVEDAKIGYKDYLLRKYNSRIYENLVNEKDVPILSDVLSSQEQDEFKYMSKEELVSNVIVDQAMDEIEYIHTIAVSYAELKKNGETVAVLNQTIADDMTYKLENLKDKVLSFNKAKAKDMIKDTYYYIDFAMGKNATRKI